MVLISTCDWATILFKSAIASSALSFSPVISSRYDTAYGMVTHAAKAGQRVFVRGLSGTVHYTTHGAQIFGTCVGAKSPCIEEAWATPMVYTNKNWILYMKELGGVHAVSDPLGFESWDKSYLITSKGGILVGYGSHSGDFLWPPMFVLGQEYQLLPRAMTRHLGHSQRLSLPCGKMERSDRPFRKFTT